MCILFDKIVTERRRDWEYHYFLSIYIKIDYVTCTYACLAST